MSRLLVPVLISLATAIFAFQSDTAIAEYRDTAQRIIDAALKDDTGMKRLEYLCTRIGNRLSGSAALEQAIKWAANEMRQEGLENVRILPVKVPHWVRGHESAMLLSPASRPLSMLGLGDSIGTPADGIEADVAVVGSFADLDRLPPDGVKGKIVVYNVPFTNYGETVSYRVTGPSKAAALGAVAVLIRSVTPARLGSPHTGTLRYDEMTPKIPAAAITIEDAESIQRLTAQGVKVRIRLNMEAHMESEADSANVIAEIRGREKPDEVAVVGGHIDSWDVGQGAHDDGSGIMASLEAVSVIHRLGLRPRRTLRVVFWTNEENGGAGGIGYRKWIGNGLKDHVVAIEMDSGAEKPIGFGSGAEGRPRTSGPAAPTISEAAFERASRIAKLLEPIGAGQLKRSGGGSDIAPLMAEGVPGFGLLTVGVHYFDWHHTGDDTIDKVNPTDFKHCTAALAVFAYVLADMPERLSEVK